MTDLFYEERLAEHRAIARQYKAYRIENDKGDMLIARCYGVSPDDAIRAARFYHNTPTAAHAVEVQS